MGNKTHSAPLQNKLQELLDRRRTNATLRNLTLPLPNQTDFSSNDFLSLSNSPQLKSAYLQELQRIDLPLGSGGSRLLDGNSTYAEQLEQEIANFHGATAGLLFNSGFDANAGFFASVPQPGDVIVYDELVHASVHDGMRLSRAGKTIAFEHNSISALKKTLIRLIGEDDDVQDESRNVFVALESIYSMDGDVCPLQEMVEVVEEVLGPGRGYIVMDEAHSTGVLGPEGRGLVCELGLEKRVFARLHTFGKAVAANGAIILGSDTLRHYLINYARPLIYTTFLSYPSLALIRSSYQLLQSGQSVKLQAHLQHLTHYLYTSLGHLQRQSDLAVRTLTIPSACPRSPIFAVQLARPKVLANFLQTHGMMVRAVVPPTVPVGTARVRICLHAGNTLAEVERLVELLGRWCESQAAEQSQSHVQEAVMRAKL
ncbi:pyridoxal phosphate-dependent transferase [Alternaria rosae]|uniref:pyridoxal phosphate-dependent transferase n=1 Tax=Alternaria rosae TaxID=1187941 RepID=UPI001E8E172D|nr:pyridoxal phosphate-dependent transferase [Alternaria rosae]KAH6875592.1 pyridoxal phosphate-dependent transferase [Alternaria rosae]